MPIIITSLTSAQISYFESISASADDILVYVTIMTVSDFLAKLSVIIVPRGTLNEVNALILSDVVGVFITLLFVLWPAKPVLIVCCVCKLQISRR